MDPMLEDGFFGNVQIIGEQDGAAEQELKRKLVELLKGEPSVQKAYLCRANYQNEPSIRVVLLLKVTEEIARVREAIGKIFAS
ncbi:MAG TPA: hypothetical protein VKR29_04185 [Candidatus Binataceae bacterium]|nr:hypothetical protein [Candidatus Binataceae bacterium]